MLLDAAGQLRTVIACASCHERAITIVAMPPPTFTLVDSDDTDVKKVLRGLAKHLRNLAKVSHTDGGTLLYRDGLEQAADFADAWASERAARNPDDTSDSPIVMQGWVCKTCKAWNGDEKERRETCRVCAGPRAVENNVSHVWRVTHFKRREDRNALCGSTLANGAIFVESLEALANVDCLMCARILELPGARD